MCVFLPNILLIWIGDKANHIESSLIFLVGLYTILFIWNNNYSVFLNATGKLNLSIGVASISVLVNIPLAIYFGKLYEKPTLGDPDRPVEYEDITRANRLLYGTAILALLVFGLVKGVVLWLV